MKIFSNPRLLSGALCCGLATMASLAAILPAQADDHHELAKKIHHMEVKKHIEAKRAVHHAMVAHRVHRMEHVAAVKHAEHVAEVKHMEHKMMHH